MAGAGGNAATATARIQPKKQTLDDAYAPPANFLEIDVLNAETHGVGNKRYTDYELRMRVSYPSRRIINSVLLKCGIRVMDE